jgi:hypothetical protein
MHNPTTRTYYQVKCFRCGTIAPAKRPTGLPLPKGWEWKAILLGGFFPAYVILCRKCKKEL